MNKLISFFNDEDGTSMAEYALLLGLITVAVATTATALGTRIRGAVSKATTAIPT